MSKNDNLEEYRSKRDFRRTLKPAGNDRPKSEEPLFVIQMHDAQNLQYDFRLEMDGVLKSWAVPKGPSTDPRERRLALPTEDHPLEYVDFEGLIPAGEYGAGPVMVWDTGVYRNLRAGKKEDEASMPTALEEGKIEVWLEGKKLKGGYALIRTGLGEEARWLLIKMDDEQAKRKPNLLTTEVRKEKRGGRVFLDYLRNAYGQTTVPPYGVRAKPGAPVATPLDWEELDRSGLGAQSYTLRNIFRRLGQKTDPWAGMMDQAQALGPAKQKLRDLVEPA